MKICVGEADFRHFGGNYFKKVKEYGFDSVNFDLCNDSQPFFYMTDEELEKTMSEYKNMAFEVGLGIGYPLDILRFVEEMNDNNFKICLDIGHAEICKSQITVGDAIRKMGDKIACFHVHDNNGWADIHTMPMTGAVDWDDVCAAIKEIGYRDDFTLETMAATRLPADLFDAQTKIFYEVAKRLVEKIEA